MKPTSDADGCVDECQDGVLMQLFNYSHVHYDNGNVTGNAITERRKVAGVNSPMLSVNGSAEVWCTTCEFPSLVNFAKTTMNEGVRSTAQTHGHVLRSRRTTALTLPVIFLGDVMKPRRHHREHPVS